MYIVFATEISSNSKPRSGHLLLDGTTSVLHFFRCNFIEDCIREFSVEIQSLQQEYIHTVQVVTIIIKELVFRYVFCKPSMYRDIHCTLYYQMVFNRLL